MNFILKAYALQDIGKRDNQEDCFFPPFIDPCHFDETEREWAFYDGTAHEDDRLFIVCDGMGGHDRGELASYIVVQSMSESILKSAPIEGSFSDEILQKSVDDALHALRAEYNPLEKKKMGTTMTVLKFHADGATIGHIGDSRVYHFRPSDGKQPAKILFRTKDHTVQNHILSQTMSSDLDFTPKLDIHHVEDIRQGDVFMLCSDGLYEKLSDDQLCSMLCDKSLTGAETAHQLLKVSDDNTDNHTAMLVFVQDVLNSPDSKNTTESLAQGTTIQSKNYTYHIDKTIGQGGFGITYLVSTNVAMHGPLGTVHTGIKLCMKEFFMHNEMKRVGSEVVVTSHEDKVKQFAWKFRREAQRLSMLSHPNIVRVLDVFEANGTIYYTMEYLPDGSLEDYVKQKKGLPEQEAANIIRQVGFALSYLHTNKMLHLDVKPANIMRNAADGTVKLIDFGLAKHYEDDHDIISGAFFGGGTTGYAPLEQTTDTLEQGFCPQLDVYALGATYYKLLTAVTPGSALEVKNYGLGMMPLMHKNVSEKSFEAIKASMEPSPAIRLKSIDEFTGMLPTAEEITAYQHKFHFKPWQLALILFVATTIIAMLLLFLK